MKLILPQGDCSSTLRDFLSEYSDKHNLVIEGQGAGLSFSNYPINLTGMRPTIKGVTIEAPGTCLSLLNSAESICDDIWTYSKTGGQNIRCVITEEPAPTSPGHYYSPKRGREDGVVVKRAFKAIFRDVFAFGDGDVWELGSTFDWFAPRKIGQEHIGFANHFFVSGGETYVRGMGMRWNYLHNSAFYGHHIDAWPEAGLYISEDSLYNEWPGGWVEPNYLAKRDNKPVIVGPGVARHKNIYTKEPPGICSWAATTTGNYTG